jgi:EAL domain-containing protein (putative c-di-GMP-specific phosphodiesterase class I)/ActR/RegA family two-component response regulator
MRSTRISPSTDSADAGEVGRVREEAAPARILIADGPDHGLGAAKESIEGAGFVVDVVTDGPDVLSQLARCRYHVLLADVATPRLDPLALLRAARRLDLDVPLLLVADTASAGLAAVAVEQGALCQLAKPVVPAILCDTLAYASKLYAVARLRRQALGALGGEWSQMGDRAALEVIFERAFDRLSIAFQPIVSWSSRRVIGHEALLRSSDPELPDPASVLAVAERLSRIDQIGRLVRERVARSMGQAPAEYVFVNLHPHELLDSDLFSPTAPLSQFAKRVVLEISEHALLDGIEHLESRAEMLRNLGFRLAMDNLGPGYPGLSSFARLRPEFVKYDLSLVRGVDRKPELVEILGSMTALFASMSTRVIAAGIESIAERDAMLKAGVDLLQGFAFSRPESAYKQPPVG